MNEQPVILYGISKVHYDKTHTIDRVMVHEIKGGRVRVGGREWRRAEVVSRIRKLWALPRPACIVTLPNGSGRPFGPRVEVLGEKFIRSIPNDSSDDNLARLPRILTSYGISKVHYERAHTNIDVVKVHKVECQQSCCDGCKWRTADVVQRIDEGDSFITLPKTGHGSMVQILRKKTGKSGQQRLFIRSIRTNEADNLRRLPPLKIWKTKGVH